jgi:hypothetical protein
VFSPERASELPVYILPARKAVKQLQCFFLNEDVSVGSFEPVAVERDEEAILKARRLAHARCQSA